jgi:hypothetical protein
MDEFLQLIDRHRDDCDSVRCPDELWARVTRRLADEASPRRHFLRLAWRTTPLAAATAALLVLFPSNWRRKGRRPLG